MAEHRKVPAAMVRKWLRFFDARDEGISVEAAARKAGISNSAAYRFERGEPSSGGILVAHAHNRRTVGGQTVAAPLDPAAIAALEDFATFRLRYFGRKSAPWQERAAYDIVSYLETPDREYVVINCPPGSGKSTLFTNDIPCWLIARDRTIRIQIGSRTERQARMYVNRIKRSLERDAPMRADADSLAAGIAYDAVACVQDDFGAFRPEGRSELWRAESLVVRQLDGVSLDDKEPTVSAWGQDSGFLGGRFDLVLWDDLVDRKNTKTAESKESIREWWGTEAETRLEPGGVLVLQGQRIAHDDLYRHCLDMRTLDEAPKYRHITYKSHDTDKCQGIHEPGVAQPWPQGCLLDPHRLPMRMLDTIKRNSPRVFEVQYQQEDGDLVGGLVDPAWITGGLDTLGYNAPGSLDLTRSMGEIPVHLKDSFDGWHFVTVDPSPTEWWGIIRWAYDPGTGNRYIIDICRRRMNPEDFLSLDLETMEFSGLMEDWRIQSNKDGAPISHVIVEVNAAQRWLLSQPHVQRWMAATGILFVPHTTTINKQDPKYGVESTGDYWRQGRCRIPHMTPTDRLKAQPLIQELTRYPDSDTTDLVMSQWFCALAINHLYTPRQQGLYGMGVPSYLRGSKRGMPGLGIKRGYAAV